MNFTHQNEALARKRSSLMMQMHQDKRTAQLHAEQKAFEAKNAARTAAPEDKAAAEALAQELHEAAEALYR